MSWLNYILIVVSIGAFYYSYTVGSTFGMVIWVIVFLLNLALLVVERLKKKATAMDEAIPAETESR